MNTAIPAEVREKAQQDAGRQLRAEDDERAQHEQEALDRLRAQLRSAQVRLGARRKELDSRREYLAGLRIELEQINRQLELPAHPGTAVARQRLEIHSVEHGRVVACCPGDVLADYKRVVLAHLRAKHTRKKIHAVTPEALRHLIETGVAEAAPEPEGAQ